MVDFVAIDVETANADVASICQIGMAKYSNGILDEQWSSYVDPQDYFDTINIYIHGITEDHAKGCPTIPQIADRLRTYMENSVCVCHTHFDRISIHRAFEKYGLEVFTVTWLDSARVARRTWRQCSRKGYGLSDVCDLIGYTFRHHDALEDAKASAEILLAAIRETGLDILPRARYR